MQIIKSSNSIAKEPSQKYLFLAGSIEMGEAEDWQAEVIKTLKNTDWVILSPRRDNWDSSWEQSITNPKFKEQVEWELNGLDAADVVLMYFSPTTKAPISLLELGLSVKTKKMIVVCPDGFWRKGNVEVVCGKYNIPLFDSLGKGIKSLLY